MSTIIITLMSVLATVLVVLLALFIYKTHHKIDYSNEIKKEVAALSLDKTTAIDQTFARVHAIAKENPGYVKVLQRLNDLHDQIHVVANRMQKIISDIHSEIATNGMKKKLYNDLVKELKKKDEEFMKLEEKFTIYSSQVTHQDEYMRNEFLFYQNHLRKIMSVYKSKRISLDRLTLPIERKVNKLREMEKEFYEIIKVVDSQQAQIILKKYIRSVLHIALVVDNAPSLFAYINKQIPEIASNLQKLYLKKKEEISSSLSHINFKESLSNIGKQTKDAKDSLLNLKIDDTQNMVKSILKSLKSLEKLINLEIASRNAFVKSYEPTIGEVKRALSAFVSIRAQLKKLVGSAKTVNQVVLNAFSEINDERKLLDKQALAFRALMKNIKIPFSAKLSRNREMLLNTQRLIDKINDFITKVWEADAENTQMRNRFRRSEAAINDLIASTKKQNIRLSSEDQASFEKLNIEKQELSQLLSKNSGNIIKRVNTFSTKSSNLYKVINGNTQIALHVQNMLKELSHKRVLNEKLNLNLQMAEKEYLEGNYAASLNIIIETVKGVK